MEIKDYIKASDLGDIKRELLDSLKTSINDRQRVKKFVHFVLSTHKYSFFNKMIMHVQFPEVTQVMGEHAWKTTYNRTLKADVTPISILAPILKSVEDIAAYKAGKKTAPKKKGAPKDKQEKALIGYRTVKVYDVTQTEGPDIELVTELGLKVDNPEDLLQELVFLTSLDGYSIDLQAMGFREGSKVDGMNIHINSTLDLESKIVEIINVLSKIHLQHFTKRKELDEATASLETKMVTAIIGSIVGTPINANINIDDINDRSITAIFKAADSVAKAIGVKLRNNEVA